MAQRMTIHRYKSFFYKQVADRGEQYFRDNNIYDITQEGSGVYTAKSMGSHGSEYDLSIEVKPNGEVTMIDCDCAYALDGGYCKHMYALLRKIEQDLDSKLSKKSSNGVSQLISLYTKKAIAKSEEPARIVPEVKIKNDCLYFSLKIGRDRLYVVNNIEELMGAFHYGSRKKYGKNFEFDHDYDLIDDKSRRVMELAYEICREAKSDYYHYYANMAKEFQLTPSKLDTFLAIYSDEPFVIDGVPYSVVKENPPIDLVLKTTKSGRLKLTVNINLGYIGDSQYGYFLSPEDHILYLSTKKFATVLEPLIDMMYGKQQLYVSQPEIPAFYNTVIRQLEPWVNVIDNGISEDMIPPQLNTQFYIDVNDDDEICGAMKFVYNDKIYDSFYVQSTNPFCDAISEAACRNIVTKYFKLNIGDTSHPFIITDENDIFDFVTTGLPELSKKMEVFVSDRFKKINVRTPAKASVGVGISGGLLEMDFSTVGYTMEELAELLKAYRRGRKFYRFKDGSFSVIDNGIKEIDTLTKELAITDKAFLKGKIKIPMYRMLYLNSLQKDTEQLRLERSKEFKTLVKSYNADIADDSVISLPESLDSVMRDYQKYGYNWLSTLGKYHMGGILADDMGLGKTLQAISFIQSIKNSRENAQCLVVCPSSLTINWQNEIQKFAPDLKTLCLNSTAAERAKLFETIGEYDVIITSYATVLRDIDKYENLSFAVEILDEAQNIKNHNTQSAKAVKAINSELRFALTGTPIENTLAELWSIFDFIMPGYLHNYNYFKKTYETPIVRNGDKEASRSLQRMTSPFILRRLKKEVLTELPDKTETVLITEFEDEQKKLYTANAAQIKGELKGLDSSTDKIKILAMLTRLRQICCDPSLVYENYAGGSAKLEQCVELIKSCIEAGHKLLLFSQFTSMLEIIESRFAKEGISYYTLTGQTKPRERIRLVNEFNENDVNVFLISLKAGGTGLNLTGADIVIHYDPWWNLSAENQASDRVYRIGQKNNVQIYKLITKGTIEEKIRLLQKKKADLLDSAIGGEGDIMNMTTDEVMSLLD